MGWNFSGVGNVIDNTFGTSIFGGNATNRAIGAQGRATKHANADLMNYYGQSNDALGSAYDDQVGYLDPYRQAGLRSLADLESGAFAENLQNDPGYQFRLQEGQRGIQNNAAARGMLNSGATLKALERYGQDYASNEYDRAYQRTANLANLGYNASSGLAGAAENYGARRSTNLANLGTGLSNNRMGFGNAQAAAQIAQANQLNNLVGQGIGAAVAYSDERLKKDIKPILRDEIKDFREKLRPCLFKYISSEYGEGEWVGVMAQDLEKSRLGRTIVTQDENGNKIIDLKKAISLLLAMEAA